MWVRTQEKLELVECSKFKIFRIYQYGLFAEEYNKCFDENKTDKEELPFVFYTLENGKNIQLYRNEYLERNWDKVKEEYMKWEIISQDETLGTYATKERCLEVLDEIERHIIGKVLIPNKWTELHKVDYEKLGWELPLIDYEPSEFIQLPLVYQMPKE